MLDKEGIGKYGLFEQSEERPFVICVGTNVKYAAIHQFGGVITAKNKTKKSVTIPARPFLIVQDEDWTKIRSYIAKYAVTSLWSLECSTGIPACEQPEPDRPQTRMSVSLCDRLQFGV